jgi:hypothetical protein
MTKDEAEAIATKREQHKSPNLQNGKSWQAVHDSVKGWHVALVDDPHHASFVAHMKARDALRRGDMQAYVTLAADAVLAGVKRDIARASDQPA